MLVFRNENVKFNDFISRNKSAYISTVTQQVLCCKSISLRKSKEPVPHNLTVIYSYFVTTRHYWSVFVAGIASTFPLGPNLCISGENFDCFMKLVVFGYMLIVRLYADSSVVC
jgi:hypothetical protein